MRILKRIEAIELDVNFVYNNGNAIAIVDKDFDKKYEILQKK